MSSTANEPDLSAALRLAVGTLYRRFRSVRGEGELGEAATSTLTRLLKNGPTTLTRLSDDAQVTPSSMSQTVNRLTAGGYARREPDPADGRRVLFRLTDAGEELATSTLARGRAWMDERLATLTPDERETLLEASALIMRIADDRLAEEKTL